MDQENLQKYIQKKGKGLPEKSERKQTGAIVDFFTMSFSNNAIR